MNNTGEHSGRFQKSLNKCWHAFEASQLLTYPLEGPHFLFQRAFHVNELSSQWEKNSGLLWGCVLEQFAVFLKRGGRVSSNQ